MTFIITHELSIIACFHCIDGSMMYNISVIFLQYCTELMLKKSHINPLCI